MQEVKCWQFVWPGGGWKQVSEEGTGSCAEALQMIGNCCKLTVIFTAGNPFVDDTWHRQAKRLRRDFLLRNYEDVLDNRKKLNDQCLDMLKGMIFTLWCLRQVGNIWGPWWLSLSTAGFMSLLAYGGRRGTGAAAGSCNLWEKVILELLVSKISTRTKTLT